MPTSLAEKAKAKAATSKAKEDNKKEEVVTGKGKGFFKNLLQSETDDWRK